MRKLKLLRPVGLKRSGANYESPHVSAQGHSLDLFLLSGVILLSVFGLLMVYDASQFEAFQDIGDKYYFIKQQLVWVVLGFLGLLFFSIFDYHRLQKLSPFLFLASLILLFLVFVPGLGSAAGGAHRWLKIAGVTAQPAEIIKLSCVLYFAYLFQKKIKLLPFLFILGLVGVIIGLLQKDLGSAVVFFMISFGMYFAAGAPIVHFAGLSVAAVLGFIGFIATSAYRKQRVLAFLDPFADPQGFSYHISQVLIALGSGGLFGVGVGQSRQKFAYIPEVTTDSIFSIVGEEFGFLGGLILIALVCFVVLRGIAIAKSAPDNFGKFLAIGLTIWIGSQAAVNLAAMVSLIPLTGVPLPFISYGGSALLANLVAVGILLNISRQT